MSISLDPLNGTTIKYVGSSVLSTIPLFIQANPRGLPSGNEWFAVVTNSSKTEITNYAKTGTSSYFTTSGQLIPFKNIVTTLMTDMNEIFNNASTFNQDISSWDTSNVTNMLIMFANANAFNQDIGKWDVSNVIYMSQMFNVNTSPPSVFNQDISSWNTENVTHMDYMFAGAIAFNKNISGWDVSNVVYFNYFRHNSGLSINNTPFSFRPISRLANGVTIQFTDPNVISSEPLFIQSNLRGSIEWFAVVTNSSKTEITNYAKTGTSSYFTTSGQLIPFKNIVTTLMTDMSSMFFNLNVFNQDISEWDTSKVTNMSFMFANANAFNQDISEWDTSKVTLMQYMLSNAHAFNHDISQWITSKVTNMYQMFSGALVFNQNISGWDTSNVTNMRQMFAAAWEFDQPIGSWDTSKVIDMAYMFYAAIIFNQNLSGWNVANVNDWTSFADSSPLITNQQYLPSWPLLLALDANGITIKYVGSSVLLTIPLFIQANPRGLTSGNEWFAVVTNSSKTEITNYAKTGTSSYFTTSGQLVPFKNIVTTLMTDMSSMFVSATSFNQLIGSWDTSKVTNMSYMFDTAVAFHQDISEWDTSKVTLMQYMFSNARIFNQDISGWDTSKVTNMSSMFNRASVFNQYIRSWNVKHLSAPADFSTGSPLTLSNSPNWGGDPTAKPALQNIFLSNTTIPEDVSIGTVIGTISTDQQNAIIYTLLTNPLNTFAISGSSLITNTLLNYSLYSSYNIIIQSTIGTTSISKPFTISITDIPQSPTRIDIVNGIGKNIPEDSHTGTLLGDLYTFDPDKTDYFMYQFVSGSGSSDNQLFILDNGKLYTNTLFNYRTKNRYSIRLKSTDTTNLSIEQVLILKVIIPYSPDTQITTLVGQDKSIVLNGTPVAGKPLTYHIVIPPTNGLLTGVLLSDKYTYRSNKNGTDFFTYVIHEGTMVSEPIQVAIYNFSPDDVSVISRNQGTFTFDNISFDGNTWRFGTFTTDTYIQNGNNSRMGNFEFYNQ